MDLSEYQTLKGKRNNKHDDQTYLYMKDKRKSEKVQKKDIKNTPQGFAKNLRSFLTTSAILVFINIMTFDNHFWAIWVLFFWGIDVINNYYAVYGKYGTHPKDNQAMDMDDYFSTSFDLKQEEYSTLTDEHCGY